MKKIDFNIVTNCGDENRTIVRYKKLCYIGNFTGIKEQAIEYISNKYKAEVKDDCIIEIEKLYNRVTIADSDVTAANNYAIKWASQNGHLEVVKYLVKKGADITANINYPLRWASKNGHLKVVKYLVKKGADITADNNYALIWVSENGHLKVVKYLEQQLKAMKE